jgi:Carboxypeptidase regulatory-like domain
MANVSSQFLRACTRPDGWLAVLACVLFGVGLLANAGIPKLRWLSPAPVEQGVAALSLSVVVESGAGQVPPSTARVRVFCGLDDGTWSLVRTADATPGGTSVLAALPSGPAWVVVDAAGYARHAFRTVLYDVETHAVRLVAASALQVTVSDEDGGPLRDATVLVREEGELPFGALTNENGEVVLTQLPPGPHRVEVFARGYESGVRTGVDGALKVALARLGALQVQVRNPDHTPAVQAEVWIVGSSLWPARAIRTNERGEAAIAGIGAGTFDLRALSGARHPHE